MATIFPHLERRAEKHGLSLRWGRDDSKMKARQYNTMTYWDCSGRIVADTWKLVHSDIKPQRETLSYVATELLGEGKHDVQSSRMDEEWAADKLKVIKYCMQDVVLTPPNFRTSKRDVVQRGTRYV